MKRVFWKETLWRVVCGCRSRRRVGCSWLKIAFFWGSNEIYELLISDSDLNPHSLLPPNRFPVCRFACHRQERHQSNTVWFGVHVPGRLARLRRFAPARHPSSEHSGCLDPRWSGCRFRFFLAHEGKQLIQFCLLHLRRQWCFWEFRRVGPDPIGNTLRIDLYHSPNRAATAFHIHANG